MGMATLGGCDGDELLWEMANVHDLVNMHGLLYKMENVHDLLYEMVNVHDLLYEMVTAMTYFGRR